jgi:ribosomal protein L7/L12
MWKFTRTLNTKPHFLGLQCLGTEDGAACDGYILPVDPLVPDSKWACTNCKIPVSETAEINAMIDNIGVELEEARNSKEVDVPKLEELYDKLMQILHPNHLHLFNLKHTLIQTYGHQPGYMHDGLTDFQLARKIEMCRELLGVLNVFDPYGVRLALYTAIALHEQALAQTEQQRRLLKLNSSEESKRAALKVFNEILELLKKSKALVKYELDRPEGLAFSKKVEGTIEDMRFMIATALMD